jgi:2-desacetyl-2-hydroxyethyl bacteriochlorophyllide A dehydrogenase
MKTMEILLPHAGGPEVLVAQERQLPPVGRREVLIEMEATGVLFAEVQMLRGRYPGQPKFPFVPGYDVVGTVLEAGAESGFRSGQRVAAMTRTGAWSRHLVLAAKGLVEVPAGLDPVDAVALVTNGVTAYQMVHRSARVRAGSTVLVHGASGGVGTLLTQLAVGAGATVIGTASPAKHDTVRALGGIPLDYHLADVPARVRELAGGGVDAVFDPVGGDGLVESWRLLAPGGRLVWYGSASTLDATGWTYAPGVVALRKIAGWNLRSLLRRDGRRGSMYYVRNATPAFRQDLAAVFQEVLAGRLDPKVTARYPLAEASTALAALAGGKVTGKTVLVP